MGGAAVEINLREVGKLAQRLNAFALSDGDKERLMKSLGVAVEEQIKTRFDTQRDPQGNSWKELAQKTRDYYLENNMGGGSLLVKEGGLRDSIESRVADDAWSVIVGASKEYAAVHQFGGEIRPKSKPALYVPGYGMLQKVNIPARPYLGFGTDDIAELQNEVDRFMREHIT